MNTVLLFPANIVIANQAIYWHNQLSELELKIQDRTFEIAIQTEVNIPKSSLTDISVEPYGRGYGMKGVIERIDKEDFSVTEGQNYSVYTIVGKLTEISETSR